MLQLTMIFLSGHVAKAQRLAREDQRGASVIEWALIAAVSVIAVILIGGTIYKIVDTKSGDLEKCGSAAPGSTTC